MLPVLTYPEFVHQARVYFAADIRPTLCIPVKNRQPCFFSFLKRRTHRTSGYRYKQSHWITIDWPEEGVYIAQFLAVNSINHFNAFTPQFKEKWETCRLTEGPIFRDSFGNASLGYSFPTDSQGEIAYLRTSCPRTVESSFI